MSVHASSRNPYAGPLNDPARALQRNPAAPKELTHNQGPAATPDGETQEAATREAFYDFVGQTFYSQMLSAMRETVGEPAYFHGGRAEEVFQGQFDQVLAEELSDASAESFSEPMYELFMLPRQ